jgi:serine protease Do
VAEVEHGGPADRAGLRPGDLIMRVGQTAVARSEDLPRVVARHPPGSKVKVEFMRERATRSVEVALDEVREETNARPTNPPTGPGSGASNDFGLQLSDVPGQGVVVTRVHPGGPGHGELESGDIVLEVNRTPVTRAADALAQMAATPQGKPALLKIVRNNKTRFIAIERR